MERIRGQITTPVWIGAGVGLVIGLIIGLIIAWGLWPAEFVDAPVSKLRNDLKRDYLVMAIQSYSQTNNAAEAQRRWEDIGPDNTERLTEITANPPAGLNPNAVDQFANAVQAGVAQPGVVTTPQAGATKAPAAAKPAGSNTLTVVLVIMCLLTLVIGGILAYMFVFRNRRPAIASNRPASEMAGRGVAEPAMTYPEGQEPPIVQYLTTYTLGNDLYDDSFSIDSPSGEFLGECGVGISETIGVGDPKKVTAFEVWLFDKNDIQTVTKVLMSQHAFNDPSINQRLASKGRACAFRTW